MQGTMSSDYVVLIICLLLPLWQAVYRFSPTSAMKS